MVICGEVDSGGDQETGEEAQLGDGLAEPEVGEGKGEKGLEVGKNGGFTGLDESLTLGVSPEGDNRTENGHIKDAEKGIAI